MTPTLAWLPLSPERAWAIVESGMVDMKSISEFGFKPGESGVSAPGLVNFHASPINSFTNLNDGQNALPRNRRRPIGKHGVRGRPWARVSGNPGWAGTNQRRKLADEPFDGGARRIVDADAQHDFQRVVVSVPHSRQSVACPQAFDVRPRQIDASRAEPRQNQLAARAGLGGSLVAANDQRSRSHIAVAVRHRNFESRRGWIAFGPDDFHPI